MSYIFRARDGHEFLSASEKRRQKRTSGLTGKKFRKLNNAHRRYRKGK